MGKPFGCLIVIYAWRKSFGFDFDFDLYSLSFY